MVNAFDKVALGFQTGLKLQLFLHTPLTNLPRDLQQDAQLHSNYLCSIFGCREWGDNTLLALLIV